jgi:AcrR family transcriptional regulator
MASNAVDEELFVRERLIRGAISLIEREGCSSLGVRRLAQASDRTTMCVYTKFGSRGGLLTAVFERVSDAMLAAVSESDDSASAFRDWALSNPELYGLLFDQPLDTLGVPAQSRRSVLDDAVALLSREGGSGRQRWIELHGEVSYERISEAPVTSPSGSSSGVASS